MQVNVPLLKIVWNLFHLGCCQCSDNKSVLTHEEGRFSSCIPHSATNYSTMYFALRNFKDMRKQLGQQSFPAISDEVVYQVIMDIVLSHPSKFSNLIPMMGLLHVAKVALHCAGKYLKGSGIVIALILAKCFGSNTIESVLSEGHDVHSLLGMQIIKEGFEILRWEAFWAEYISDEWLIYKDVIKKLCLKLCSKVPKDANVAYELYQIIGKMKTETENLRISVFKNLICANMCCKVWSW